MPLCGECVSQRPGKPSVTCDASVAEDHCKDAKASVASTTAPAEALDDQPADGEQAVVDVENIATEEEADRVLPEGSQRTLHEEAGSLFPPTPTQAKESILRCMQESKAQACKEACWFMQA